MPFKDINIVHMKVASTIAELSYAKRKKVGAIITKDGRIISTGYNGMPSGMSNECESQIVNDNVHFDNTILRTKPEVVHAEANAILFAAKNGQSTNNSNLYVTMSPCVECAKMIIQSGIIKVYYKKIYRNDSGLKLLLESGIEILKIDESN